ncbi:hypothetical protein ACLM48_04485, partial [Lactococcus garvieae]
GEEYLYLEQQGADHLIIRHEPIRNTSFNDQPQVLSNWFSGLDTEVRGMAQPVSIPAVVPGISEITAAPWEGGERWISAGWATDTRFDTVRADRTVVNSSGTPQAFALSMADVVHLSTETGPFPNHARRVAARDSWWWLRTPALPSHAWLVHWAGHAGELSGGSAVSNNTAYGGVRPAIIIHQ